jgi:hypothetical protein
MLKLAANSNAYITCTAMVMAGALLTSSAFAQPYPVKPVRAIFPISLKNTEGLP